jgi:hypothetical protein
MAESPGIEWALPYGFKERFYSGDLNGQVTVREAADRRPLDGRTDLHNYSATFDWGHDSAGAAQLSLALLSDALSNDVRAQLLHHHFKRRVIVDLPTRWTITRSRILAYARMIERNVNFPTS